MKRLIAGIILVGLAVPVKAKVRTGIDVLERENFKTLEGAKVGLITNHTGIDGNGQSTADLLHAAKNLKLISILSPEHGFRGDAGHGEAVADETDAKTGLPVHSLYGQTTRPTDDMLKNVDTLVFDIQDIGTRFYTYIATMGQAMEEAAHHHIRFVVLDRPNPLRGDVVDGELLDPDIRRLTGYFSIPLRHGFTVGELADWYNQTEKIGADLVVVKMEKWKRSQWFDETGLTFHPPSPNILNLTEAILYNGIGCFEATNISVGRGTPTPFEIFGAPWINGKAFCAAMREKNLPGVVFEPAVFTPEKDIYAGQKCEGVRMMVTDRNEASALRIFLNAFLYLLQQYPKDFKPDWDEVRVVTGSSWLKDTADGRKSLEELLTHYEESAESFRKEVEGFYLY